MSLDQLESKFRRLAELRMDRDVSKKSAESAEREYRAYESELLDEIEESGIRGALKFDFGGDLGTVSFSKRETIYGRVIDAEAALAALTDEHLFDEMTSPKIESRRLNELVRERIENGEPMPDGIDFYSRKFVSISRKAS